MGVVIRLRKSDSTYNQGCYYNNRKAFRLNCEKELYDLHEIFQMVSRSKRSFTLELLMTVVYMYMSQCEELNMTTNVILSWIISYTYIMVFYSSSTTAQRYISNYIYVNTIEVTKRGFV